MSILFLVIGNSGAGKDTVIRAVLEKYPSHKKTLKVPKRVVTRKSSISEDYESVDIEKFNELKKSSKFAFDWESYTHYYGIRKEIIDWLRAGHPVIVNVSRDVIKLAKQKFPSAKVIFIRVPLEVTVNRIIERGRESHDEILDRVVRARDHQDFPNADLIVDNIDKIEETSQKILDFIINECSKIRANTCARA
ncbi:hypothetical protein ACFL0D_05415, partial [Thermoproteota archaeon]